jgi:nitrate/nitrite transporter NarK
MAYIGIRPFFFSHSDSKDAPRKHYAMITKYFVIFGSFLLLSVIVFADLFKDAHDSIPIGWL